MRTPADEVNNLNPIVFAQHSPAPIITTHNFAIEFDRNSRRWQIELAD